MIQADPIGLIIGALLLVVVFCVVMGVVYDHTD